VYVLKKEEGGRHTPFFNGYRPQFYIGPDRSFGKSVESGCKRFASNKYEEHILSNRSRFKKRKA